MNKITANRIVILQSQLQIENYLNTQIQDNDLIIPIGPDALFFIEKNNLRHYKIKDFIKEHSYEEFKIISNNKIKKLIFDLNEITTNLEIGNYFMFQLEVIIGQLHYNYFIVESIINNFFFKEILIYYNLANNSLLYEFRPDITNLLNDVFKKIYPKYNFKLHSIGLREKNINIGIKNKILSLFSHTIINKLRTTRNRFRTINFSYKTKYKLLLIGGGYDWFKIAKFKEFNNNFKIEFENINRIKKKLIYYDEVLNIINVSINFNGLTIYEATNITKEISEYTFHFLSNFENDKRKIKKFSAVISSVLTFPGEMYLAHIAKMSNIPVIIWQHGEKGQAYDPTIFSTEICYTSNYFTYADSVNKFYLKYVKKNILKSLHTVGSISKNVKWINGNTILYATGKWFYTASSIPVNIDPDTRQFYAQKDILSFLNQYNNVTLKANNTRGFNKIPFNFNNINIDYTSKFTDLLINSKLVILDTPATTLIEACSTRIPIFVLGGRNNYYTEFLDLIKKRVVWCENTEDLIFQINTYLELGIYNADINNDEYIYKYNFPQTNEIVQQSVINNLIKIINNKIHEKLH